MAGVGVWELLLALGGESAGVEFVAAAVVESLSGKERAALVASFAVGCPRENVGDGFGGRWLGCAVNEDCTCSFGLAQLVLWQRHVAVLEILHCYPAAGCDGKAWICGRVVGGALRRVAQEICAVDTGTTAGERREEVIIAVACESGIRTSDVPTSVPIIAGEVTSCHVDGLHLLDPGVSTD